MGNGGGTGRNQPPVGAHCCAYRPGMGGPVAQHLIKRTYSEPHWERAQGAVMATEKVTVYGLPIVAARKVNYSQIDPALCRELFIRHALVEGDWQTRHAFFRENLKLRAEVEELEHKSRRRDILVDDETLFEFYDQRISHDVISARHFDSWWKKSAAKRLICSTLKKSMLIKKGRKKSASWITRTSGIRAISSCV